MSRLPALRPKTIIQCLQRAGFYVHHTTGSHYILKHPDRPTIRVTVPYRNRDLKRGTLHSILRQAALTEDAFLQFL